MYLRLIYCPSLRYQKCFICCSIQSRFLHKSGKRQISGCPCYIDIDRIKTHRFWTFKGVPVKIWRKISILIPTEMCNKLLIDFGFAHSSLNAVKIAINFSALKTLFTILLCVVWTVHANVVTLLPKHRNSIHGSAKDHFGVSISSMNLYRLVD